MFAYSLHAVLSKLLHCFIAVRFLFLCEKTVFLLIRCFQDFSLHPQNLSICEYAHMCVHLCEHRYAHICISTGVHATVRAQVCTHLCELRLACVTADNRGPRRTPWSLFSLSLPLSDFWSSNAAFRLAYQALTTDPSLRHSHDVNNVSSQSFLNPSQLVSSVAPC